MMQVKTVADVGRLIREARTRAGMTQAALAGRFGTTQSWISEVENGKDTAEIGKILKMLWFLGLRLDLSHGRERRPDQHAGGIYEDFPDIDGLVDDKSTQQ